MQPGGIYIPEHFNSKYFTGIIKTVIVENIFNGIKNLMPIKNVKGQQVKSVLSEDEMLVSVKGVRNFGQPSHKIGHKGLKKNIIPMFPYSLNDVFDASDWIFRSKPETEEDQKMVREYITQEIQKKKQIVFNSIEYFIWQILKNGKLVVDEGGVTYTYDYALKTNQLKILPAGEKWTNTTTGNPLTTIREMRKYIQKTLGGGKMVELEMVRETAEKLFDHPKVSAKFSDEWKEKVLSGEITAKPIEGCKISLNDDVFKMEGETSLTDYLGAGYVLGKIKGPLGATYIGESLVPANGENLGFKQGMYSYPDIIKDPPSIKFINGATMVPVLEKINSFVLWKVF